MSVAKKLVLIVAGYALAVGGGIAAVGINELLIPDDIKESSGGMVAFGDMIMFVLGTGVMSLAPTWFLLKPQGSDWQRQRTTWIFRPPNSIRME